MIDGRSNVVSADRKTPRRCQPGPRRYERWGESLAAGRTPSASAIPRDGRDFLGIRVHRTRLDAVAKEREVASALVRAIETMDSGIQLYKSLGVVRSATFATLRMAIDMQPNNQGFIS